MAKSIFPLVVALGLPSVAYMFVSLAALLVTLGLYEFMIRRIKPLCLLFGLEPEHTLKSAQSNIPAQGQYNIRLGNGRR